ncbi:MAG: YfhO family protein [Symbiobacteriaceae bacterium]|nr:YfhO family protein [Symbiobacteriaceae bacterium]
MNNTVTLPEEAPELNLPPPDLLATRSANFYLAWAFATPFLLMALAFAVNGIFPFAKRQIMVTDLWQQYYPFLREYWHRLREGASLLWSWSSGLGFNYLALIAYYLASPLNLLIALFPLAWLREVITLLLLLKIGLAGFFCALYLRHAWPVTPIPGGIPPPVAWLSLSTAYALSAFTLGYYWNIMWMDTVALLPLIALGLHQLMRQGRCTLYIGALAVGVISNFYIGYIVCIYVALLFGVYCLSLALSWRDICRRFGLIALSSGVALGLTAFITLPAYHALQNAYSAATRFPTSASFFESFTAIMGNFLPFLIPTSIEGLPNIYCGWLTLMLTALYLVTSRLSWRERLAHTALVALLLLSCNLNMLSFIWHGFHVPNQLPYRLSFLIPFTLVTMAYRALTSLERFGAPELLALGGGALIPLASAAFGSQPDYALYLGIALGMVYLLLLLGRQRSWSRLGRYGSLMLLIVVLVEHTASTIVGVTSVGTTSRETYLWLYDPIQELLAQREEPGEQFYRTDFTKWYTHNDPTIYGYEGITFFSSTANVKTTRFMEGMGVPAWDAASRYYFSETSPLTNAFLGLRYLISRDGSYYDTHSWEVTAQSGYSLLLENRYHLPFAFWLPQEAQEFTPDNFNPLQAQNQLFSLATGLSGNLFTLQDILYASHSNYAVTRRDLGDYYYYRHEGVSEGNLKWHYEIAQSGYYYAFAKIDYGSNLEVLLNNSSMRSIENRRANIFSCGWLNTGDTLTLTAPLTSPYGNIRVYVARFDEMLFNEGYALLAGYPCTLEHFGDTSFRGTITSPQAGWLYTSLPYEEGWSAYIDGKPAEITLLGGAMAAIPLAAGEQTIHFTYHNAGLKLGLGTTLAAALGYLALSYRERRLKAL